MPSNAIANLEQIINFYSSHMEKGGNIRSLYDITTDRVVSDILAGKTSLKTLKQMPKSLETKILSLLEPIDRYRWQQLILESAVTIAFEKSKAIMGDWQKFYDMDGCRDFHEVIYINHHEQEDDEDYIEINQFNSEFYYTYQQIFHKMYPDPELDINSEW